MPFFLRHEGAFGYFHEKACFFLVDKFLDAGFHHTIKNLMGKKLTLMKKFHGAQAFSKCGLKPIFLRETCPESRVLTLPKRHFHAGSQLAQDFIQSRPKRVGFFSLFFSLSSIKVNFSSFSLQSKFKVKGIKTGNHVSISLK